MIISNPGLNLLIPIVRKLQISVQPSMCMIHFKYETTHKMVDIIVINLFSGLFYFLNHELLFMRLCSGFNQIFFNLKGFYKKRKGKSLDMRSGTSTKTQL